MKNLVKSTWYPCCLGSSVNVMMHQEIANESFLLRMMFQPNWIHLWRQTFVDILLIFITEQTWTLRK